MSITLFDELQPSTLSQTISTTGSPKRYHQTREKALELFAKRGYSRVSMRDLAEFMGIRAGSLYNHIESKEALLFELIEELYEQLLDGALELTHRDVSPTARLLLLTETHLQLHNGMGAHFRLAEYDVHYLNNDHQERILKLRQLYEAVLIETVEQLTGEPACMLRRAGLASIVSQLNQLPAWFGEAPTGNTAKFEMLREMIIGSIRGVLQATQRIANSVAQTGGR
ncbi:TetR/AcrR family transcriptional regulator [Pseudomonas sp. BN414]|nr:TetR/AcrR family transcriptional regulator [Pseudomonas sp. BN414]MDH4581961.1 TetR/AcrR family transcriptional regulator [Pseudomonas sp. BN415]